jgi:ubiquinone/menaquinone biosynthesis C-methylase UbiE
MKRKGIHAPTIEDAVEISGIESLHPGGFALTRRTAELAELKPGMKVLDVSSGRGTQSVFYARNFGVEVVGVDISEEMIKTATDKARQEGVADMVSFVEGDSQDLPFEDDSFDAVINECAVGIPDDSQAVLNEMVRVAKPDSAICMHESTWRKQLPAAERDEISERYGTTPLDYAEWIDMFKSAGARDIVTEFDEWSRPEMFWKIRINRDVKHWLLVLTLPEQLRLFARIYKLYGIRGVLKIIYNEVVFFRTVRTGKLGYCLFRGTK